MEGESYSSSKEDQMRVRLQFAAGAVFALLLTAVTYAATPRSRVRTATPAAASARVRITTSFDQGWRFLKADAPAAEKSDFDDTQWRNLDVPHDWSIEGPIDRASTTGHAQGFFPAGIGWYRKHFVLPESYAGRRVFVEFDGVMANSDVWINGRHLGRRPYGYVSFRYELTGNLKFGKQDNILAVRADNSGQPASRWYAGAGIYRHVRLVVTDPVHLDNHGVFVTTPSVNDREATVHVQSKVVNQSDNARTVTLQVSVAGPDAKVVKTAASAPQVILPGHSAIFDQDLAVASPMRWDIAHPYLSSAAVRVRDGNKVLDDEDVRFGIREVRFDPATGFWLNGNNFKLKGVCLHHDGGAFGAAVPLDVWKRRLQSLRELGVNAIRTAHNPPSPEFLDLTDEMGFLVMDEMFDAWTVAKNPYDYHLYFGDWSIPDTAQTVQRDRNHPSVIIYSAGNEIHDTPKPEMAKTILASLVTTFHQYDPSRPVTQLSGRTIAKTKFSPPISRSLSAKSSAPKTDTISRHGWRCGTVLLTLDSSCGPGSTTSAKPGPGLTLVET
jgi:beta-galactosidase